MSDEREAIELLARYSDWAERDIRDGLQREVYAGEAEWRRLLQYLLLGAGAAFMLSGIVFFFAYNWAGLPRQVKIGTVGGTFVLTALLGIFAPLGRQVRNVALTAAVALIGITLAVLGQVYQTGADSYELFLVWTLFALPWVGVVHFAPLWLLWVALINVTFLTYTAQGGLELVANFATVGLQLLALNIGSWVVVWGLWRRRTSFTWLLHALALWIAVIATINISVGSLDDSPVQLLLMVALTVATYGGWVRWGFRQRSIYYLAVVGASSLIAFIFVFLRFSDLFGDGLFLGGLLALGGMTALANYLNRLNKRWHGQG